MRTMPLCVIAVLFWSCNLKPDITGRPLYAQQPTYATLFAKDSITLYSVDGNGKLLSIIPRGQTDFRRIVLLNTTHLGYFKALNSLKRVVGVVEKNRLVAPYDSLLDSAMQVGRKGILDLEKILLCSPDLVICNSFQKAELERLPSTIKLLEVNEFNEQHPLAFSEWLLFFGELLDESAVAQEVFEKCRNEYELFPRIEHAFKIGTLYRFGNKYFSTSCTGRQSELFEKMGMELYCFGQGLQAPEITKEQALVLLQQLDYLFFLDWFEYSRGRKEVLAELELGEFEGKILYCNAKESKYYEELMMQPAAVMKALSQIIKGKPTPYFVIL